MKSIFTRLYHIMIILPALLLASVSAGAFSTDTYTTQSVLSSGRWMKVAVKSSGIYFIPAAALRSWGFSDISKVSIHGYGGAQLPEQLTRSTYIDDLPEVPAERTSAGIYFYASGIETWTLRRQNYTPTLNAYSTEGFYYVTQTDGEPLELTREGEYAAGNEHATQFTERLFHEVDQTSISGSGQAMYGEDFRYTRSRSFRFDIPDRIEDERAWVSITFAAASTSQTRLEITIDGQRTSSDLTIRNKDDNYGAQATYSGSYTPTGNSTTIGLNYVSAGIVEAAHLDKITINYQRRIKLLNGKLSFEANTATVALEGADEKTQVWDVTDPLQPFRLNTAMAGGRLCWTNPYTGRRRYEAWSESGAMASVTAVGSVANQNLHGISELPDMVIFTVADWAGEAERLANFHRAEPDNFNVLVVRQDEVFNEFSSGTRDPNAFRKMLKMLYDRGEEAGHPLRYVLMFGRPTYDNRALSSSSGAKDAPFMPTWQSPESLTEGSTYTSDDIFGILGDNSGNFYPGDRIQLSVGRIPARTLTQAKSYVDKLLAYDSSSPSGEWKNNIVLEADNGNAGVFMTAMEKMQERMLDHGDAQAFTFNKVYVDAFPIMGGVCVKGRERFYRMLDDGIFFWIYNGHGAIQTLCGEGMHSRSDINSMYNKRWPVLFAATCSFSQWDGNDTSGAETLAFNANGGAIATLSATRKVFVSHNNSILSALGYRLLHRDSDGKFKRLGDYFRDTKNIDSLRSTTGMSRTKLCYVLLGDPAMRLTTPSPKVTLETIDGDDFLSGDCVLMARQRARLAGTVYGTDGEPLDDFNGTLAVTIYDSEYSTTSSGLEVDETGGRSITFEEMGNKLYSGRGTVKNGRFEIDVVMPSEIADNWRPATINFYAKADDGREAMGNSRDFHVFGYDENAEPDTTAPVIDYAYLNHSSFTNGSVVNEEPMFLAGVSDDVSINMSTAGIGHQMMLKLDDSRSYNDVSLYYTPAADGSPSGTVSYPMSELSPGNHTLTFRVWDTDGNSTSHTLSFFVEVGAAPQIFDIFTDANPATTHANFYISHNRPDANAEVTLEIYSIAGRRVWTSKVEGRSDMFLSTPIQWNLCDMGGARVGRDIYIYRATIKIDGHELQTSAKRIAVTGN